MNNDNEGMTLIGYSQDALNTTEKAKNGKEGDETENTAPTIMSWSEVKDKTEGRQNNVIFIYLKNSNIILMNKRVH